MDTENLDLTALVGEKTRDLFVTALQALWRERVAAWNVAANIAADRKTEPPERDTFAIDEVSELLRRVGAQPTHY